MEKEKINLGLFTSVYSYFLFLLLKGYNKNDIIIVHDSFPKELSKNINPIIVPVVMFKYGNIKQSISKLGIKQIIIGFFKYLSNYIKLRILLFTKTFNKKVENYGHTFSLYSFMFYENENSNIIEDGLMNYTNDICETHKINPIIDKFLHLFGIYFLNLNETFGSHKNIKKIYLTNEFNHPLIKDKVEVINMNELWNKLSKNKKEEILNLFNIDLDNYDFDDETVLILTQQFDGTMSLDEELNIYKEFIDMFKEYSIIIKPHPRDNKNYNEIFPNIKTINGYFPIELLNLIGIKPKIICTVLSTAAMNFQGSKIYIYEGKIKNEFINNARNSLIELIEKQDKAVLIKKNN